MNKEISLNQALRVFFIIMFLMVIGCSGVDNIHAPTYAISGTISGDVTAGVTITLAGTATASITTDTSGNYSFTGLASGNYTVTPSLTGYIFSPSSWNGTINTTNVTGKDFTAQVLSISGTVTGATGLQKDVTINLTGAATASTTTNTSGNYSFTGLVNGNTYTVTPSLTGYVFTPSSKTVTVNGANITSDFLMNVPYAQADLTGTWILHSLTTSSTGANKWQYATTTVDSSGNIIFSSCGDSTSSTTCPTNLKWTIGLNGVITDSGDSSLHMTMTSNKNFIAGTSGAIGGTSASLIIAQKVVTGTTYSVNGQSFVFHQLSAGGNNEWRYGAGTTNGSGIIIMTGETGPNDTTKTLTGTLSVDSNGGVTISSIPTFNGFLADDNKTIVGTYTDGSNYKMMIIQITGKAYTAGPLPAGVSVGYLLVGGGSPASLWNYFSATVNSTGTMTLNNVESSNSLYSLSGQTFSCSIDVSGVVNMADTAFLFFHGQLSDDGKFIVGIETFSAGTYGLFVFTK